MPLILEAQPVPLAVDADGVCRIDGTRVTLDTVVAAYREGATPEEIVDQYPSIKLDHVYAVIGYYLRHQDQVDRYLSGRAAVAAEIQSATEKQYPPHGVRDRLMARRPSGR